jgi:hypothetical protein
MELIMSFIAMTYEHVRVSIIQLDDDDETKLSNKFRAKSSSKDEPSGGTAAKEEKKGKKKKKKKKGVGTEKQSNTKVKHDGVGTGSSTAHSHDGISVVPTNGSTRTLPVPVLNTGTPLDGSSADIHGAITQLVASLNTHVSNDVLRLIYQHIVDLREAERHQAHIIQALAHQMAELSVELEEFRSGKKDRRSIDAINAMVQVEAKGSPLRFDRSFSIRTINLIIQEHPELSSELTVLRNAIQEQESQMSESLSALETETHGKVFEAFKKIAKLEKHLEDKNAFIRGCYESLDKFELEVSISSLLNASEMGFTNRLI